MRRFSRSIRKCSGVETMQAESGWQVGAGIPTCPEMQNRRSAALHSQSPASGDTSLDGAA